MEKKTYQADVICSRYVIFILQIKTTVLVKVDIYLAHSSPCCVCAFSQIIHILHHECLSVSTLKASSTLSVKSDLIPLVHSMISEDLKGTGHFHNQHPTICPSLCVCVCGLQFILLKTQNPLILIFLHNAIRSIDFYQMDLPWLVSLCKSTLFTFIFLSLLWVLLIMRTP